jgi:phosphopantetheinyl transferase
MGLYKEWKSDPYSLAAIWKIEEPESFFTERTGLTFDIKNEKKRMERLAGRFLLKHLEEDFPLMNIRPDEHDKPRIDNNQYYFSISHSWPYVAAVISPYVECGIDIQCWHPQIGRLQNKFLAPEEQLFFKNDTKLLSLAWSAKEAGYKWQGRRGVDFIGHLPIISIHEQGSEYNIIIFHQLTKEKMQVSLKGCMDEDFSLAYVIHDSIFHPY